MNCCCFYTGADSIGTMTSESVVSETSEAVNSETESAEAAEDPDSIGTVTSEAVISQMETSKAAEINWNQTDSATFNHTVTNEAVDFFLQVMKQTIKNIMQQTMI